jgi:hypothetical protein
MRERFRLGTAVALACVLAYPAVWAQSKAGVSATTPTPSRVSQMARVLWLDKQTNVRVTPILQGGVAQTFNGFELTLGTCAPDVRGVPGQDMAWLTVREPGRSAPWFEGWMNSTLPDIATLDHPRFDLMLLGCGDAPRRKGGPVAKSGPVPTQDDEAVGVDSESVGGTNDPFYVPGVSDTSQPVAPEAAAPEPAPEAAAPAVPAVEGGAESPPPAAPTPDAVGKDQDILHRMMDGQ